MNLNFTNEQLEFLKNEIDNNTFNLSTIMKKNIDVYKIIKREFTPKDRIKQILQSVVREYEFLKQNDNLRDFFKLLSTENISRQKIAHQKFPKMYASIIEYINNMPELITKQTTYGEQLECWELNSYEKYMWILGEEGQNYLTCPECNKRLKEFSLQHVKMHEYNTVQEFLDEHNLTTNKCQDLCDKMKGDKNPGFQHGGKFSPFSKKFVNYKNLSNEETQYNINLVKEKIKESYTPDKRNTRIEFYLAKGMSEEEAKLALIERQTTFSLKKCIMKYGEIEGRKIWEDRQIKWINTLLSLPIELRREIDIKKGNNSSGPYSKISLELFRAIHLEGAKWGSENDIGGGEEWFNNSTDNKNYLVDFLYGNKIIEFFGDYYHANPEKYTVDKWNSIRKSSRLNAEQIWEKDKKRIEWFESQGFEVKIVWENDYRNDKTKIINECIAFLESNNNEF